MGSQRRRAVVKERVAVRRRLQLGRSVRVVRLEQRLQEVMKEERLEQRLQEVMKEERRAAVLRALVLRRRRLEMEGMRGETKGLPQVMEVKRTEPIREERTMEQPRLVSPTKETAQKERERMARLVERREQARSPKPHRRRWRSNVLTRSVRAKIWQGATRKRHRERCRA